MTYKYLPLYRFYAYATNTQQMVKLKNIINGQYASNVDAYKVNSNRNNAGKMRIVLIGAGNLATNLGKALLQQGLDILQVYSRTLKSASILAETLGASSTDNLDKINPDADVYIISISDGAISEVVPVLCKGKEQKVFLHTAGSVPITVFEGMALHYGVLYPMQTFSKDKQVNFNDIPCFIEGNDKMAFETIRNLADSISDNVRTLDSNTRKHLHLAAVFACNFVNHCYEISSEILAKHNIPFDVMLPLIDETSRKIHTLTPLKAQTGPAIRYDKNIIRMQSDLLKDNPMFKQIYECMSMSIYRTSQKEVNSR